MKTNKYKNFNCIELKNSFLSLKVTQSVGPRIIFLEFNGRGNIFAELPDVKNELPDGRIYSFYGGHRLWHSPENIPRTYNPDDEEVTVNLVPNGVLLQQKTEELTGLQKSMQINLAEDKAEITVFHTLTNQNLWAVECSPWAITQIVPGGVALLPQSVEKTGLLPNRSLAVWPYTDLKSEHLSLGNHIILLKAEFTEGAFKIGFPNPHGWLAYWLEGTLFVKKAVYNPQARYFDFNSSHQCYCSEKFIELETLGPISNILPGDSVTHIETWNLYSDVDYPADEETALKIVKKLNLG